LKDFSTINLQRRDFHISPSLFASLLPLLQGATLLFEYRLNRLQALDIAGIIVDILALGQRLLRRVEMVTAYSQILPRLVFLVCAAEREVCLQLVVRWEVRGMEEFQESSGDGASGLVACECLVDVVSGVCDRLDLCGEPPGTVGRRRRLLL
jgi:hypothetical protein